MNDNPRKQTRRLTYHVEQFYGTICENVDPLQGGYFRLKIRTQRRHGMPIENPVLFYPRRLSEIIRTYGPLPRFFWKLWRMRRRVLIDPEMLNYTDQALHPIALADDDAGQAESKRAASARQAKERAA